MSMYKKKPKSYTYQKPMHGLMIEFFGIVRCLVKSAGSDFRPSATAMLLDDHPDIVSAFLTAHYGKLAADFVWYVSSDTKEVRDTPYLIDHHELLDTLREIALYVPTQPVKAPAKASKKKVGQGRDDGLSVQGPLERAA